MYALRLEAAFKWRLSIVGISKSSSGFILTCNDEIPAITHEPKFLALTNNTPRQELLELLCKANNWGLAAGNGNCALLDKDFLIGFRNIV